MGLLDKTPPGSEALLKVAGDAVKALADYAAGITTFERGKERGAPGTLEDHTEHLRFMAGCLVQKLINALAAEKRAAFVTGNRLTRAMSKARESDPSIAVLVYTPAQYHKLLATLTERGSSLTRTYPILRMVEDQNGILSSTRKRWAVVTTAECKDVKLGMGMEDLFCSMQAFKRNYENAHLRAEHLWDS